MKSTTTARPAAPVWPEGPRLGPSRPARRAPGVDGYLEQIRPDLGRPTNAAPRSSSVRRTPESVTLSPAGQSGLGGLPRRPVPPGRGRDRRRQAHPLLLAGIGSGIRPRARTDGQGPTPRASSRTSSIEKARPGHGGRARPRPRATSTFPTRRPERDPADQRRQRHHSGDLDAADAVRRGAPRARSPSSTSPPTPSARSTATSSSGSPRPSERPPGPLLHAGPGAGEVDGHFRPGAPAPQIEPEYAAAETFACGPPALLDSVRELWAAEGIESRLHVESFVPPTLGPASGVSRGRDPFRRLRPRASRTAVRLCSSRPRRPDSGPRPAAGWASATPAPAASGGHGPATSHRRALLGRGRGDPDLRLGTGRRRRRRALTTPSREENSMKAQKRNHGIPEPSDATKGASTRAAIELSPGAARQPSAPSSTRFASA